MRIVKMTAPLIVFSALAAVSFGQPAYKIALVNSPRAFEQSTEGKKAIAQLQERENKIKADLQKMDDALRAQGNRLSAGQLTMTAEALRALQADVEQKTTERKRYEEDAGRDAQQFQINIFNRIKEEMVGIIKALRKEKGYDLIVDVQAGGVVDFDPAIDITDEVVRRYDASKAAAPPVKK